MGVPSRLAAAALLLAGVVAGVSALSAPPSSACPVRNWNVYSLTMDVPRNGQALGLLPIVAMVITVTIGYLAWRQRRPSRSASA
jgi:hypothetical protein